MVNQDPNSSREDMPKGPGAADRHEAIPNLEGLLRTQEVQVIGAMGIFVGYICVFLAKILNLTNPYYGVLGVAILTILLLTLSRAFNWRAPGWWVRATVIVVICLLLTSPQLYFAWSVSVREAQAAVEEQLRNATSKLATASAPANITVTNGAPAK
jgi:hypothetical protein